MFVPFRSCVYCFLGKPGILLSLGLIFPNTEGRHLMNTLSTFPWILMLFFLLVEICPISESWWVSNTVITNSFRWFFLWSHIISSYSGVVNIQLNTQGGTLYRSLEFYICEAPSSMVLFLMNSDDFVLPWSHRYIF